MSKYFLRWRWWWVAFGSHLCSLQPSVCLCFAENRSAVTDAYLKRKSMTHIWSFHLSLPKPKRLKCLSIQWCPTTPPPPWRAHIHTGRGLVRKQTHKSASFDLPLSSLCNPSIILSCHSTVSALLKKYSLTRTHTHTRIPWSKYPHKHKTLKNIHMHKKMKLWAEEHSHTWIFVCVRVCVMSCQPLSETAAPKLRMDDKHCMVHEHLTGTRS